MRHANQAIEQRIDASGPGGRAYTNCLHTAIACVLCLLPLYLAGCWNTAKPQIVTHKDSPPTSDTPVTRPSPPRADYVGSKVCATCHREISKAYASHPMGNSLSDISDVTVVEDYRDRTEFAPPGNRKYRVERTPTGVFHHEAMYSPAGDVLYDQSVPIDYSVGSGMRGRSYLTNRDGMLFMSSIGWYSQGKKWDLSPGYRPQSHRRFDRQVSDGCLTCHAGRMNTVAGLSNTYDPHSPFLEESIGCERCHGPAESHVSRHRNIEDLSLSDHIVNPAKLGRAQQEAVCNQCHFQGSRRIPRYGQTEFSFRPGNYLTDVWQVNLGSEKQVAEGGFRAVTQAEQMHESACYQKSQRMGCTSCHDPHRSVAVNDRSKFYSDRCAECHGQSSPRCALPSAKWNSQSCIDCHMPRLAASDVPHTSQTDHRIPRDAAQPTSTEKPREIISLYDEGIAVPAWEKDRATGILLSELSKRQSGRQYADRSLNLLQPLANKLPGDIAVLQALGLAYLQTGDQAAAVKCWVAALEVAPQDPQILESLAVHYHQAGDLQQAKSYYERLIKANGWRAEFHGRYAHVLGQLGESEPAIKAALRCLELNPTISHVHNWLAEMYQKTGRPALSERHRKLYEQFGQQ